MNVANENQHWISQHLLKRLKITGRSLQCYQVETGDWVEKSIERALAAPGYNQLLVYGEANNSLETAFSKIESRLPNTLRALEDAIKKPKTELPREVYENLCWYCAFLKGVAPYSKPGSVVAFILQLNMELERSDSTLLRELGVPDDTIRHLQQLCTAGRKVIVESENLVQLLYRFQFARNYQCNYAQFLSTKWGVSCSPIEFPMSDVGLVPLYFEKHKAEQYLLPLGPNLLLQGVFFHDLSRNSSAPVVRGIQMPQSEAQSHFDSICASAISELVCARKLPDIAEARRRAKENGIRFCKIPDPKSIKTSGLAEVNVGDFRLRVVSAEEYKRVVHSHILPWS